MLSQVWKYCHASVCSLNFLNERGVSIDSLTGFKVDGCLITSEQAFYITKAKKVEITFVGDDANTVVASMRIPYSEFVNDLKIGFSNNKADYAVFNIDFPDFENIPSLRLSSQRNFSIGSNVAFLSFGYGKRNLSLKSAIISSYHTNSDGIRFLEFDGQTSFGNSGSPIINPLTMEVIGIVSRRTNNVSKAFNQLMDIISTNLDELKRVEGVVRFGDIDPIQVLVANQNQLKHLATNIYRYTVSSSSQAVMLDHILTYFNEKSTESAYIYQSSLVKEVDVTLS